MTAAVHAHVEVLGPGAPPPPGGSLAQRLRALERELEVGRIGRARTLLEEEMLRARWRYRGTLAEVLGITRYRGKEWARLWAVLGGRPRDDWGTATSLPRGLPADRSPEVQKAWAATPGRRAASWFTLEELRGHPWGRYPQGAFEALGPPRPVKQLGKILEPSHAVRLVCWVDG